MRKHLTALNIIIFFQVLLFSSGEMLFYLNKIYYFYFIREIIFTDSIVFLINHPLSIVLHGFYNYDFKDLLTSLFYIMCFYSMFLRLKNSEILFVYVGGIVLTGILFMFLLHYGAIITHDDTRTILINPVGGIFSSISYVLYKYWKEKREMTVSGKKFEITNERQYNLLLLFLLLYSLLNRDFAVLALLGMFSGGLFNSVSLVHQIIKK